MRAVLASGRDTQVLDEDSGFPAGRLHDLNDVISSHGHSTCSSAKGQPIKAAVIPKCVGAIVEA